MTLEAVQIASLAARVVVITSWACRPWACAWAVIIMGSVPINSCRLEPCSGRSTPVTWASGLAQLFSHCYLKMIIPAPSKINLQVCFISNGSTSSPPKTPSTRVETMAELSPLSAISLTISCISLGVIGEWTLCPPSVTRTGNASAADEAQLAHAIFIFLQSVRGISPPRGSSLIWMGIFWLLTLSISVSSSAKF